MPESTTPRTKKKRPSWLSGEEAHAAGPARRPAGGRGGPLAEDGTGEMPNVERDRAGERHGERPAAAQTETIPRVSVSGAGERPGEEERVARPSPAALVERLRANPAPASMVALVSLVLVALFWFLFLDGGGEAGGEQSAAGGGSPDRMIGAQRSPEDPFGGGPVRDSGVVFGALQEDGGEATLDGAGLNWSGTVTEKEGQAGQTVTLEGPTAAQLERGFDLGPSGVETGVYAVAQDGGQVLHVTTHTFVPEEEGRQAEEMTLGTVYALEDGELGGYAYYLDRREPGSNRVTRTYVSPGESSYRVSYEAPPAAKGGTGTFVPLLVGWRGFDDGTTNEEGE
jgi:limonene-1,2-epoxide hydrolase